MATDLNSNEIYIAEASLSQVRGAENLRIVCCIKSKTVAAM
jgi:hypothetical protein